MKTCGISVSEEPSTFAVSTGNAKISAEMTATNSDVRMIACEMLSCAALVFCRERWMDATTEQPAPIISPMPDII